MVDCVLEEEYCMDYLGYFVAVFVAIAMFFWYNSREKKLKGDYEQNIKKLNEKNEEEKKELEKNHSEEINSLIKEKNEENERIRKEGEEETERQVNEQKEINADNLRMAYEHIRDNRDELMKEDEKNLLIDIVQGLAGYGKRIDRIEKKLLRLEEHQEIVDKINEEIDKLNMSNGLLKEKVDETMTDVNSLNDTLTKMNTEIDAFCKEIKELETVKPELKDVSGKMAETVRYLNEMKDKTDKAVKNMSDTLESLENNPFTEINQNIDYIQESIGSICEDIDEIQESLDEYNKCNSNCESILEIVSEIKSSVDNVEEIVDHSNSSSYNSYYDDANDISSKIEDMSYDIRSIMEKLDSSDSD